MSESDEELNWCIVQIQEGPCRSCMWYRSHLYGVTSQGVASFAWNTKTVDYAWQCGKKGCMLPYLG